MYPVLAKFGGADRRGDWNRHDQEKTRGVFRYPRLVMGFWTAVVAADLTWLLVLR